MSWLHDLVETYKRCVDSPAHSLPPLFHASLKCHIEATLNEDGRLLRLALLDKAESIEVPATEQSQGRSGKNPAPHPLCDKVKYLCPELAEGGKTSLDVLGQWVNAEPTFKSLRAVHTYLSSGTLARDLAQYGLMSAGEHQVDESDEAVSKLRETLSKLVGKDAKTKEVKWPDAVLRWVVQPSEGHEVRVWESRKLQASWMKQMRVIPSRSQTMCMVTGETGVEIADLHPKGLFGAAYNARLISSNDKKGFTYLGQMKTAHQAFSMGTEASQMAHAALRYLIKKSGIVNANTQSAVVAWRPSGLTLPSIGSGSAELVDEFGYASYVSAATMDAVSQMLTADIGKQHAEALRKMLRGSVTRDGVNDSIRALDDDVVVLGMSALTKGRLAVTHYQRLKHSQFLARLERWHLTHAWPLRRVATSKEAANASRTALVGAPSLRLITKVYGGEHLTARHERHVMQRVLRRMLDGKPLPDDIVDAIVRKAINRHALGAKPEDVALYEETLDVACAVFRGQQEKEYPMEMDITSTDRNVLFGRLLAIAHFTELKGFAAGRQGAEARLKRLTSAEQRKARFHTRPSSTFNTIADKLTPYRARLKAANSYAMGVIDAELNDVMALFTSDSYNDVPVSGAALLGYHQQLARLNELLKPRANLAADAPAANAPIVGTELAQAA